MPVYATEDADSGTIAAGATIRRFDTEAEARVYLLRGYTPDQWDLATVEIGPGRFSDAWQKWGKRPRLGDSRLAPFSYRQLSILGPGQHPGGFGYWVTPDPDVLVVQAIAEREDV